MKIAWFSSDWAIGQHPEQEGDFIGTYGGTFHYRMALPSLELDKQDNYTCLWAFTVDATPDGSLKVMDMHGMWHDDCDIIVFQRWMAPDADTWTAKAVASGQKIVNDVDDYFWTESNTNLGLQAAKTNDWFNRDNYLKMITAGSATVCSTSMLARALERKSDTFICRNAIDIESWKVNDPGDDALMIGWVGGVSWRANDLAILQPVLPKFLVERDLAFYHGGDSPAMHVDRAWDQIGIDMDRTPVATLPLCPITEYPQLWEHVSIALVPLEDCSFNRAKSWLKSLEASAAGVPYISTDLPEQRKFVEDGGAGRLAKKPWEWKRHLMELQDPGVRREEGRKNRLHAQQHDISLRWHQWDNVFKEIMQ